MAFAERERLDFFLTGVPVGELTGTSSPVVEEKVVLLLDLPRGLVGELPRPRGVFPGSVVGVAGGFSGDLGDLDGVMAAAPAAGAAGALRGG